jgi:hypothetical protein
MLLRPINQPPRIHYNYDELETCPCFLCVRSRTMGEVIGRVRSENDDGEMVGPMGRGYGQTTVPAWQYAEIQRRYAIATNKRNLYCELSWLTRNKTWQEQFLSWVLDRIDDPKWASEGFWSNRCEIKSLGSWVADWYESCQQPPTVRSGRPKRAVA